MAFTSPVFTSISTATPTMALMRSSSSRRAFSQMSCMPTSMVDTTSQPSWAGMSTMFR